MKTNSVVVAEDKRISVFAHLLRGIFKAHYDTITATGFPCLIVRENRKG